MINLLPPAGEWKDEIQRRKWFEKLRSTTVFGDPVAEVRQLEASDQIKILSEYNGHIIRVSGKGGPIINGSNPQISAGASDIQLITIEGSSDTNTYQLNNGNGIKLKGTTIIVLKQYDIIALRYNKVDDIWIENYRN